MSEDSRTFLDFSDDELSRLLSRAAEPMESVEEVAPSDELREVSRRIAGQYVELIEAFAAGMFHRKPSAGAGQQLVHALDALDRLGRASGDEETTEAVAELKGELLVFLARQARGRGIDRMATRLRAWIPRFAGLLEPDVRARLLGIVSYRGQTIPLFQELGAIPGIGPRRLERLYCAGLNSVEVVVTADPEEIAQVTGLPPALARRVVEATRAYEAEQRRRAAREFSARAEELLHLLQGGDLDPEVLSLARAAVQRLRVALESTPPMEGT